MANEVRITVTSRDKSQAGFQSARRGAEGVATSTQRIGQIAAGIIASQVFDRIGQKARQAFTETVAAASNLNESINAANVTFGEAADGVLSIGENSATSMGLSKRAFNEAAVTMSNFAKTVAGEGGDVAGVIEDITGRASDFASVMNLDVEEALRIFRSGLAGESEPLRKYGIDVSAAAVQTFAYANGIAAAGAELTEAEKVQARYGLIMEQTAATAGDFAATSDDMANAQRIANAEMENAKAAIGEALLPVLAALHGVIANVARVVQDLPAPLQAVIGAFVGLVAVAGTLLPVLASARLAFGGLGRNSPAAAAGIRRVGSAAGFAAGALAALLIAKEIGDAFKESEDDLRRWYELLTKGAEGDPAREIELIKAELEELDAIVSKAPNTDLGPLGNIFWTDFSGNAVKAADRMDFLKERLAELEHQQRLNTGELEEGAEGFDEYGDSAEEAAEAVTEAAIEAAAAWGEAVADIADANQALSDANADLKEDEELTTAAFIEQFEKRVKAAEDHNENIVTIQERTSAEVFALMEDDLRNNPQLAAMIAQATGKEFSQIEGLYKDGAKAANSAANRELVNNIPELGRIASRSGQTFAEKIAGAIRSGRSLTYSEVSEIMAGAKSRVERQKLRAFISPFYNWAAHRQIERDLNNLARSRTAGITPAWGGGRLESAHGGIIGAERGMQTGGVSGAMSTVLMNELRPEVVELPNGSRVIPSLDQAFDRNQFGGSGGPSEVRVVLEVEGAEDAFVEALRRALRVRGERLGGAA